MEHLVGREGGVVGKVLEERWAVLDVRRWTSRGGSTFERSTVHCAHEMDEYLTNGWADGSQKAVGPSSSNPQRPEPPFLSSGDLIGREKRICACFITDRKGHSSDGKSALTTGQMSDRECR